MRALYKGVICLVAAGAILYLFFFRRKGIKQGMKKLLGGGWEAMFGLGEDKSRGWVFFLGMTLVIIGVLMIASEG